MTCRKNYWGTCFQHYRKKYLNTPHVDGKREIACFHVEMATGKREIWRENRGHVVIFAVRVSRIRDTKSLYYLPTSSIRNIWRTVRRIHMLILVLKGFIKSINFVCHSLIRAPVGSPLLSFVRHLSVT